MTLRHLSIFIAVCKYKSVTAAAESLYLAQPTVSLAIRELEEHYDIRLFDRISRKLYLTEPGKQFLNYATRIVSLYEEMETGVRDCSAPGPLRIGASITIGTCLLPAYVSAFGRTHPQVKVYAAVDNSLEIEKRVLNNGIDLALVEGAVHSPNIVSEQFMEDEMVLICGNSHALAASGVLHAEQLGQQAFLLREKGSAARELFDSTLLTRGISVEPIWESISTQAIINAVAEGHGLSVLPRRLVEADLAQGHVRELTLDIGFRRAYYIIYHQSKFLTQPAKEFIALCKAQAV